jgi:hypothetical protein
MARRAGKTAAVVVEVAAAARAVLKQSVEDLGLEMAQRHGC